MTSIILPFSALDGAGIDRNTIRPLHVRPDRFEHFDNVATLPLSLTNRPLPTRGESTAAARAAWESDNRGYWPNGKPAWDEISERTAIGGSQTIAQALTLTMQRTSKTTGAVDTWRQTGSLTRHVYWRWHGYQNGASTWFDAGDTPRVNYWFDGSHNLTFDTSSDPATVRFGTERHWLGDSLFMASVTTTRRVPCPNHVGTRRPDDTMTWCDTCGQSVKAGADVPTMTISKTRRMRFLSSFDYNERVPLYFLAALPHTSRARTVEMAYDDLAPAAIHAAYARGLDVKRQGDIFFVPTPLTDDDIAARAIGRARLYTWTHTGNPRPGETGYTSPPSAAVLERARKERRQRWHEEYRQRMAADTRPKTPAGWRKERRAARAEIVRMIERHTRRIADADNVCQCRNHYDHADAPCEACGLPVWFWRYTVDAAVTGLAREQTRLVEWQRKSRNRNTGYCTSGKRAAGSCYRRADFSWHGIQTFIMSRIAPTVDYTAVRRVLAIHGTGHTATEVAVCQRGVTYVRGIVRHAPAVAGERRDRDHAAVKLDGARWYLAIRNTVPRA